MSNSRARCSSPSPSPIASVLSKDSFRGHVASATRHGMLLPSHQGGTYLSTCFFFTCFRTARLTGAGTSDGSSLHRVDSILQLLGLLTLHHRGFCGLTHSTTTSLFGRRDLCLILTSYSRYTFGLGLPSYLLTKIFTTCYKAVDLSVGCCFLMCCQALPKPWWLYKLMTSKGSHN